MSADCKARGDRTLGDSPIAKPARYDPSASNASDPDPVPEPISLDPIPEPDPIVPDPVSDSEPDPIVPVASAFVFVAGDEFLVDF